MREKIERKGEYRIVIYDYERWKLLEDMRREALKIIEALKKHNIYAIVHGSIARGDVKPSSDIDVFVPQPIPVFLLELVLEEIKLRPYYYVIVQATPQHTPKVYIVLDEREKKVVSFPLAKLNKREYEFYFFGGALDYKGLIKKQRVPGVDKRLIFIEPIAEGHKEMPVIGNESIVARKLRIEIDTVLERIRVLSRRDEIGRTGVFVKEVVYPPERLEEAIRKMSSKNPYFRRVLVSRGSPYI